MQSLQNDEIDRVQRVVDRLEEAGAYGEEQVEVWASAANPLKKIDPLRIASYLAAKGLWRWLYIIVYLLAGSARNDQDFVLAVSEIAERIRGDLAGGPFWELFVDVAAKNPALARELVPKFLKVGSSTAGAVASMLLVGIARGDPDEAVGRAQSLTLSPDPNDQEAGLRALAIMIREGHRRLPEMKALVIDFAVSQTPAVRVAYVECLASLHQHDHEGVEGRILELFLVGDESLSARLLERAAHLPNFSMKNKKAIFEASMKSPSDRAGFQKAMILAQIGRVDPRYALDFIRSIMTNELVFKSLGSDGERYVFRELGAAAGDDVIKAVYRWLDEPTATMLLQLSSFLISAFEGKPSKLIESIRGWSGPDSARFHVRLSILKDLISADLKGGQSATLQAVEDVFGIAAALGIDPRVVSKGEQNKVFQALHVINSLLSPIKPVDYDMLFRNLDRIPHVRSFFGSKWFEDLREKNDTEHIIPHMFDHKPPSDDQIRNMIAKMLEEPALSRKAARAMIVRHHIALQRVLSYWDNIFSRLDPAKAGMGQLRRDLMTNADARDFLCEAEVVSLLLRYFEVNAKPKIPGVSGWPDARVRLPTQTVILEVYNPRLPRELELASGARGLDIHRMKKKVHEKYRRQFERGKDGVKEPLVIVIHATGAILSEWDIDDMLWGTKKLEMLFDKKAGRAVAEQLVREADAITHEDPGTAIISGILTYRKDIADPTGLKVTVAYYPNPLAHHPLSPETVSQLGDGLAWPGPPGSPS